MADFDAQASTSKRSWRPRPLRAPTRPRWRASSGSRRRESRSRRSAVTRGRTTCRSSGLRMVPWATAPGSSPGRTVTGTTVNGNPSIAVTTGTMTSADMGRSVTGAGIPAAPPSSPWPTDALHHECQRHRSGVGCVAHVGHVDHRRWRWLGVVISPVRRLLVLPERRPRPVRGADDACQRCQPGGDRHGERAGRGFPGQHLLHHHRRRCRGVGQQLHRDHREPGDRRGHTQRSSDLRSQRRVLRPARGDVLQPLDGWHRGHPAGGCGDQRLDRRVALHQRQRPGRCS